MPAPAYRPGTVGIVIVAFNDFAILSRCIASVRKGGGPPHALIVIDNSTTDEVEAGLKGSPDIHYHRTGENLGFSGANNVGFRIGRELGLEYSLMLNHDAILGPGALSALVARAESLPDAGVVTGKIVFPGGKRIWYAGGYFDRLIGAGKNLGFNEEDTGRYDSFREVGYATGCLMLIPNRVLERVGPLSERIFMYLDDIEFCLRVRAEGLKIYYEPKAVVEHDLGSGSHLPKRPDYYLYFSIRNKPLVVREGPYALYLYFATVAVALIKLVQFALHPGIPARAAKLRGIALGLLDAFSSRARHRERFPRLFRRG